MAWGCGTACDVQILKIPRFPAEHVANAFLWCLISTDGQRATISASAAATRSRNLQ